MMTKPPLTPAEHITQAKNILTTDASPDHAIAHTLIAIAEALTTADDTEHGTTPTVSADDIRGMTCAQAVIFANRPCKGQCTHELRDADLQSTIVDPDCFR